MKTNSLEKKRGVETPENGWLEDEVSFLGCHFFTCLMLVSGRVDEIDDG